MKHGFTLIELLAVIVILAIIALIATPIVLSIISDSKVNSGLRSAEMYLKGVEYTVANTMINNTKIPDGTYKIMSNGNICLGTYSNKTCTGDIIKVEVNGEVPKEGSNIIIKKGKITDINLLYNNNTIIKNTKDSLIYFKLLDEVCEYVNNGVAEKTIGAKYTCDFGAGARNFYILELGTNPVSNSILEKDEVALILEGNYDTTTPAWCDQKGENPSNNVCDADGLTAKLDEIASVWIKLGRKQIGIPSGEQIMVADGKSENSYRTWPAISNEWLYSWDNSVWGNTVYGYWTSSPRTDDPTDAWSVYCGGYVYEADVNNTNSRGVRPVITLKL